MSLLAWLSTPHGPAAEQPDRVAEERVAMPAYEPRRLLEPAAHVGRAPDDVGVVTIDRVDAGDRAPRDVEPVALEGRGDPLCDALRRAVTSRIHDEDLHGRLLSCPRSGICTVIVELDRSPR